jgi:hypothetical protein
MKKDYLPDEIKRTTVRASLEEGIQHLRGQIELKTTHISNDRMKVASKERTASAKPRRKRSGR